MNGVSFTARQKLEAVEREIRFRRRVFPRFIGDRKMSTQKAEFEIEIMEAISADYRVLAERERLI